jgi:hypothetical protein
LPRTRIARRVGSCTSSNGDHSARNILCARVALVRCAAFERTWRNGLRQAHTGGGFGFSRQYVLLYCVYQMISCCLCSTCYVYLRRSTCVSTAYISASTCDFSRARLGVVEMSDILRTVRSRQALHARVPCNGWCPYYRFLRCADACLFLCVLTWMLRFMYHRDWTEKRSAF